MYKFRYVQPGARCGCPANRKTYTLLLPAYLINARLYLYIQYLSYRLAYTRRETVNNAGSF